MGDKSILLADEDPLLLEQFRQALGEHWFVNEVSSAADALEELKSRPYDVLVAGLDLGDASGSELLNNARRRHPKSMRFVLASEEDKPRVMKEVLGAHQFLAKPLDLTTLKRTVERAVALDGWIASDNLRALVSRVRTFPAVPAIYLELLSVLRSPDATTEQVGDLIAKDMAMTTKLLQVLNSAYFGLPSKITNPAEAVGILGFETVKSMVMAIKLLGQYDKLKPIHFSIDQLWRHSTDVARSAKQIVLMHGGGHALAETAFTAGLMHDLGKVVLAVNFDEQYRGAQSLARKQDVPLWEVEKEIFGATHGEVGAYLLGLWGMPLELLEVAALHHFPGQGTNFEFSALTAVHVANILEHETHPENDGVKPTPIDENYLTEVGVLDCLASWRQAVSTGDFSLPEVKVAPMVSSAPLPVASSEPDAAPVGGPGPEIAPEPAAAEEQSMLAVPIPEPEAVAELPDRVVELPLTQRKKWAYVGAAAAALMILGALAPIAFHPADTKPNQKPDPGQESNADGGPTVVRARSLPEPLGPALPPGVNLSSDASETESSDPRSASAGKPAEPIPDEPPVIQAPTPEPAPIRPLPATNTVASFGDIKLQGLILSTKRPVAILNGRLVEVNDRIAGARVLEIGRSNVVLEYQNQRHTLNLK